LVAIALITRFLSWAIFELGGFWFMQDFHRLMVAGLQRVRTTYFDENPSGRIINRLVNDFENLKSTCIVRFGDTLQALLEVLSIATLVLFANPSGAILIIPTIAMFLYIQWSIAPMLQRLTAVRSIRLGEVIHRETDLIDGARTFLLYGAERALLMRLRNAVERYVHTHLLRVRIEAWGRLLSSSVTSTYSFVALVMVGIAVHGQTLTFIAGSAIVTVILRLTPSCSWLAWSVSLLIESVGTAKRAFEIVDLPSQELEEFSPNAGIPVEIANHAQKGINDLLVEKGDLVFDRYSMSYRRDSPLVLRNFDLRIPYGTKVGIVGRTGSGKTSLMQSLFRLVYVHSGDIRLGSRSIFECNPRELRKLFAVVPQDPYLVVGTIRSNIDPDGSVDDAHVAEALTRVGLLRSLSDEIAEGGKNLSVGERQLVCLARIVTSNCPYILLDEPTSAVDNISDLRIQFALGEVSAGRTVIAIAHRVETLGSYDLIVEMDAGTVARIGPARTILSQLTPEQVQ